MGSRNPENQSGEDDDAALSNFLSLGFNFSPDNC